MGYIQNTEIQYMDEKLSALGVDVKMPKSIQTFIVLKKPIELPHKKGATTQEICVLTLIDYKGGFFGHYGKAGETLMFPARHGQITEMYELTNMPRLFHKKNAWAAIEEHQKICVKIAKEF